MIPVDQIRTGKPQGQCTEASVASLLEVELHEIPELWAGEGAEEPRPTHRCIRMYGFVLSRGYQWCQFAFEERPLEKLDIDDLNLTSLPLELARGHHLILGKNPDGLGHMCVGKNGKLVHDPNPSRRGLVTVDTIAVFVPLEMVSEKYVGWIMRHYDWKRDRWVLHTAD